MNQDRTLREIEWLGDSRERLRSFPDQVRQDIGYALHLVQLGETPTSAKPFKGLGSGVYEVVDDYDTNTYRAIYAVKLGEKIYVLHAFQKKSPRGRKTSQRDINLIKRRFKQAQELAKKENIS
jgi:phage-related protein